jgi:ketosteroid isomerase-like protein
MKAVVSCVLIMILARPIVAQQNAASPETKVVALEKAWNQAYKFRDKKALSEILHDSIVLIDDDGSLQSRAVFLAGVDASSLSDQQQAEPESISVQVFGNVAIATGVFRKSGIENGKAYVRRNRFVDSWIYKEGSWVCVAASAIRMLH